MSSELRAGFLQVEEGENPAQKAWPGVAVALQLLVQSTAEGSRGLDGLASRSPTNWMETALAVGPPRGPAGRRQATGGLPRQTRHPQKASHSAASTALWAGRLPGKLYCIVSDRRVARGGGRGAAEGAHRPFVRIVEAENLAAVARHRGLVRLVLQNKAAPDGDLGLEFYISSSRSRLARGRCHLEQRRTHGCPSCGRPATFARVAWTPETTHGPDTAVPVGKVHVKSRRVYSLASGGFRPSLSPGPCMREW